MDSGCGGLSVLRELLRVLPEEQYVYFSDNQQRIDPKRFITRWRLEPKDSVDAEKMKALILKEVIPENNAIN